MTRPMVRAFPTPGPQIKQLYRELNLALNGTAEQQKALGPVEELPRPWIPATVTRTAQRSELWAWIDAFVVWLNEQYAFDPSDLVPGCWPEHPHLVHELAAIADLRWRAELDLTPTSLEEWHRYGLPAFLDRMRRRVDAHCENSHPDRPPSGRTLARHSAKPCSQRRWGIIKDDLAATDDEPKGDDRSPWLRLVDVDSGELLK